MRALKTEAGRNLVKLLAEPIVARVAPHEADAFQEIADSYLDDPRLSSDEPLASGLGLLPDMVIILCFVATTVDRLLASGRIKLPALTSWLGVGAEGTTPSIDSHRPYRPDRNVVDQALEEAINTLAQESRETGWDRPRLKILYDILRELLIERSKIPILFLGASPDDRVPLRLDRELRAVTDVLRGTRFGERIRLVSHLAARVADLQGVLLEHQPHILHFGGHGSGSTIVLEGSDGRARPVSAKSLSLLFGNLSHPPCCVVLNACYSAAQAYAIAQSVEFVVGMSEKISDEAAFSFSRGLYRALASGESLSRAVELGRSQIDLDEPGRGAESPILIALRSDPGSAYLLKE